MDQNTIQSRPNPLEVQVFIGGHQRIQNQLLARYLQENAALPCCISSEFSETAFSSKLKNSQKTVFLWDCLDTAPESLWKCLDECSDFRGIECYVALFNVKPESGIENTAIQYKIRGIFYINDPPEILAKGIQDILKGQLWFSRQILTECLLSNKISYRLSKSVRTALTPREKEILGMIGSGISNNKIADTLCISVHTVKTHLYNIYKKVRVSNRTQAAFWAAQNL